MTRRFPWSDTAGSLPILQKWCDESNGSKERIGNVTLGPSEPKNMVFGQKQWKFICNDETIYTSRSSIFTMMLSSCFGLLDGHLMKKTAVVPPWWGGRTALRSSGGAYVRANRAEIQHHETPMTSRWRSHGTYMRLSSRFFTLCALLHLENDGGDVSESWDGLNCHKTSHKKSCNQCKWCREWFERTNGISFAWTAWGWSTVEYPPTPATDCSNWIDDIVVRLGVCWEWKLVVWEDVDWILLLLWGIPMLLHSFST